MVRQRATLEDLANLRTVVVAVLLIHAWMTCAQPVMADSGIIRGAVVNGSRSQLPIEGAQVALRARIQGQFTVIEETTTDSRGRFLFDKLPVDAEIQYIPGANQDEVHYPGPRLRLTTEKATANVKIIVYDSAPDPNPLVIRQHDILVKPGTGAVEVTESIVIENPSKFCYVGQSVAGPDRVVTLRLSIPPDFERVTFEKEFFGRRFLLIDGKLLTGIPWPPGKRVLKFTYVVPNEKRPTVWRRSIDLPCSHLQLSVETDKPEDVRCNLEAQRTTSDGVVTFSATDAILPTGREILLEVGSPPTPMMVYGRWTALAVLGALICGTTVSVIRPKRPTKVKPSRRT
jgi:hypothetical protein